MRRTSILSIALVLAFVSACSSPGEHPASDTRPATTSAPASEPEDAPLATTTVPPMPPRPVFDDARVAWTGEWPTTSRITHSTCKDWPLVSLAGTTRVIRHNENVFQVRRINGWSAYGVASDEPELTLQQSWTDRDGSPIALTLKLRFENEKKFVMTTEIVVAPSSAQPEGCEAYLEEIGIRS